MTEGDTEFFEIDLPGLPPSVNQLYATVRGNRVKSKVGREYSNLVSLFVRKQLGEYLQDKYFSKQVHRPIRLELYFHKPSWHCVTKGKTHQFIKRDLDNFVKAVQDSLFESMGLDDSCIVELRVKKVGKSDRERTHVRLWFLGDEWNQSLK